MNYAILISLTAAAALMMFLEWSGARTTLALKFKGDIKRETRWLAQYGQAVCTTVIALLVWRLDTEPRHTNAPFAVAAVSIAASIGAFIVKRMLGRVRPGWNRLGKKLPLARTAAERKGCGGFLGPTIRHANWRESFPSSHSASAASLSVVLATLYPSGIEIFWALAITCAVLRYLMDAHWPSDVLGGIALGYAVAHSVMPVFSL